MEGRAGVDLMEHWSCGPRTLVGVHVRGFPNMFVLVGPQGPGVIANVTATILQQVDHIVQVIRRGAAAAAAAATAATDDVRSPGGFWTVEPSAEAEQQWGETCAEVYPSSVFSRCTSWCVLRQGVACGLSAALAAPVCVLAPCVPAPAHVVSLPSW